MQQQVPEGKARSGETSGPLRTMLLGAFAAAAAVLLLIWLVVA
jgi:hypothetical protein